MTLEQLQKTVLHEMAERPKSLKYILIHPDDYQDFVNEFKSKVYMPKYSHFKTIFGVRIIRSEDIAKGHYEIIET